MKTEIWAHRGASLAAPENTIAAFEEAVRQGADGIELDVQQTKDGYLVVSHDDSLERTANVQATISEMTLQAIKQLDVGSVRSDSGRQTIPTLKEVFELIQPSRLKINVELKNTVHWGADMAIAVIKLAQQTKMADRLVLSSFNHYSLFQAMQFIRQHHLPVQCGALYMSGLFQPWVYARQIGVTAIHPYFPNLAIPNLVESCHQAGIQINAWTIDKSELIQQALLIGVDAIITNIPDLAIKLRQQLADANRQQEDLCKN